MDIKKVLVANRGEIAIRIFRACTEIGLRTVGIYTFEDRYSLHRYKADEAYQIGSDNDPLKPYLDIDAIIRVAKKNDVDAIHPGYGFLSENAEFAQKCEENDIIFVGPKVSVLKSLGDKVRAKEVAVKNDIPVIQSNEKELDSVEIALEEAEKIGYPVMLKAASGGGGRGMRVIRNEDELKAALTNPGGRPKMPLETTLSFWKNSSKIPSILRFRSSPTTTAILCTFLSVIARYSGVIKK